VIEVATELADRGGYDAVVMKDVADRSGVALATLYRWFASKDHLLAEVLLRWMGDIAATFEASPPRGRTASARVAELLRRIVDVVAERPHRLHAVTSALLSSDAGVVASQDDFHQAAEGLLAIAIGSSPIVERATTIETLEHVLFSSLVHLARNREDAATTSERFVRIARHVVLSES
jgi:AcrR family transcriptional regulator